MRVSRDSDTPPPSAARPSGPSWRERVADALRRIFLPGIDPGPRLVPVPVTIPRPGVRRAR